MLITLQHFKKKPSRDMRYEQLCINVEVGRSTQISEISEVKLIKLDN